eukprot:TRINITY_DN94969_c0_g1_i1.p1 TRINITY_DN94969_c0_g1~~TRINITY_DN94969_c0_g1_i1.p1  ORF type:complete len:405 (+),score=88.28 TRINITY_DN94969_c0_g1_i1:48-1217(+)
MAKASGRASPAVPASWQSGLHSCALYSSTFHPSSSSSSSTPPLKGAAPAPGRGVPKQEAVFSKPVAIDAMFSNSTFNFDTISTTNRVADTNSSVTGAWKAFASGCSRAGAAVASSFSDVRRAVSPRAESVKRPLEDVDSRLASRKRPAQGMWQQPAQSAEKQHCADEVDRLRFEVQQASVRNAGLQLQGRQERARADRAEAAKATAEAAEAAARAEVLRLKAELRSMQELMKACPRCHGNHASRRPLPSVPVFKAPSVADHAAALRKIPLPPPKPEDSCTVFSPEREDEVRIPQWCENYLEQVEKCQADVDPDTIFGTRLPICNLDEVFPPALVRKHRIEVGLPAAEKRKRGDSGDWESDPLTRDEICVYKSRMGQTKSWRHKVNAGRT